MQFQRRGVMLVIASPSGAGKTSITRAVMGEDDNISLSISVTTRERRTNELEGRDYYFIDKPAFDAMRRDDELLESAEVHGNFYGTPAGKIEEMIASGHDVLFDIDWQGTQQLTRKCRPDMVTVFVLPPSITALRDRLEHRAQDSAEVIEKRLKNAREEMEHFEEYDYVLINEDLQESVERVRSILRASRLWRRRQTDITSFVKDLQKQIDSL
jgi:guanylate kinase